MKLSDCVSSVFGPFFRQVTTLSQSDKLVSDGECVSTSGRGATRPGAGIVVKWRLIVHFSWTRAVLDPRRLIAGPFNGEDAKPCEIPSRHVRSWGRAPKRRGGLLHILDPLWRNRDASFAPPDQTGYHYRLTRSNNKPVLQPASGPVTGLTHTTTPVIRNKFYLRKLIADWVSDGPVCGPTRKQLCMQERAGLVRSRSRGCPDNRPAIQIYITDHRWLQTTATGLRATYATCLRSAVDPELVKGALSPLSRANVTRGNWTVSRGGVQPAPIASVSENEYELHHLSCCNADYVTLQYADSFLKGTFSFCRSRFVFYAYIWGSCVMVSQLCMSFYSFLFQV